MRGFKNEGKKCENKEFRITAKSFGNSFDLFSLPQNENHIKNEEL